MKETTVSKVKSKTNNITNQFLFAWGIITIGTALFTIIALLIDVVVRDSDISVLITFWVVVPFFVYTQIIFARAGYNLNSVWDKVKKTLQNSIIPQVFDLPINIWFHLRILSRTHRSSQDEVTQLILQIQETTRELQRTQLAMQRHLSEIQETTRELQRIRLFVKPTDEEGFYFPLLLQDEIIDADSLWEVWRENMLTQTRQAQLERMTLEKLIAGNPEIVKKLSLKRLESMKSRIEELKELKELIKPLTMSEFESPIQKQKVNLTKYIVVSSSTQSISRFPRRLKSYPEKDKQ